MFLRTCILSILVSTSILTFGQEDLWAKAASEETPDTTRVLMYDQLIWPFIFSNPDTAVLLIQEQSQLVARNKGRWSGYVEKNYGVLYAIQAKYDSSLNRYERSLKIFQGAHDSSKVAALYNLIGVAYQEQGRYITSIDYHLKSRGIREAMKDTSGVVTSLINIGLILQDQNELESALEYYTDATKLAKEIGDVSRLATVLQNTGSIYYSNKDYKNALRYYRESYTLSQELNDQWGVATLLINIGKVLDDMGATDSALYYMNEAEPVAHMLGDQKTIADLQSNRGMVYIKLGKVNDAIKECLSGLTRANEFQGLASQKVACNCLHQAYDAKGNHKEAYKYHQLYIEYRDSLANDENTRELTQVEMSYSFEKEQLTDSLRFESQRAQEKLQYDHDLKLQKTYTWVGAGIGGLVLVLGLVLLKGYRDKKKANLELEDKNAEISAQKLIVEEKNKEILDSITYAKRIQEAILPPTRIVKEWLPNSFILYKPKDIVAGDFYWMEHVGSRIYFSAADCTGHGVPGAMVSVVCHNAMNRAVREFGLTKPGEILDKTASLVVEQFEKSEEDVKDGMDLALCVIDTDANTLGYAGANNPLWIIRNGSDILEEVKATKKPIGKSDNTDPFETHEIALNKGDTFYVFSDGYADQFGGERGKKYKYKTFKDKLLSIQSAAMEEQRHLLDQEFEAWRGELEQLDDVCVIGVRV